MIKRKEDFNIEVREHMKGGEGHVDQISFASKEELLNHSRLFGNMHLEPHCEIGNHTHENEMEVYYVVNGEGIYNDNGTETTLKAGDVSFCYPGETHGFKAQDVPCDIVALIILQ